MDNKSYEIYTDLAIESREYLGTDFLDGVLSEEEEIDENIKTTWVKIINEQGASQMGKPIGNYVTIESSGLKENMVEAHEKIIEVLSEKISQITDIPTDAKILVVGLGNWNVTPDALGPKVISKILVTRHIMESIPEDLFGSVRQVSALSPGVMGITGIETFEIVLGVCNRIKPDLVIAIDALAARKTSRINTTIQMTDTGINPGSGMGNARKQINENTLGIPVIAIGVPTVVDAATLANDTIDRLIDDMVSALVKDSEFYDILKNMNREEKHRLITEILDPYTENMFVTPKEVDAVIERISGIIANSINIALHPGITTDEINKYVW